MAVNEDISIIDVILADINAVVPNFSSLVSSYRLLVGSAEEIHRTPGVPIEIFQRSVLRYDRAGTLIDLLLELLCCKIAFASNFLSTVCAPIDLPRYFVNESDAEYTPQHTAEQIVFIELLRLLLTSLCEQSSCFGPPPPGIGCPPVPPHCLIPPSATPAPATDQTHGPNDLDADAADLLSEIAPEILTNLTNLTNTTNPSTQPTTPTIPTGSATTASSTAPTRPDLEPPLRRKHYTKGTAIRKPIT